MPWQVLLLVLLRLFGPVLAEWLRRLLADAADGLPGRPSWDGGSAARDIVSLFDAARRRTWVWERRKRAVLRAAERVALARAGEVHRTATTGWYQPVLAGHEAAELRAAQSL